MIAKKVLIVDDDKRNVFALKAVLKAKGFACITCDSGSLALKLITHDDTIGIVLLDMMMPDMDGYETLQVIRQGSWGNLPVVAVTAQAMLGDEEKCLAAGANAYLSKPIDVDRLLEVLHKYMD